MERYKVKADLYYLSSDLRYRSGSLVTKEDLDGLCTLYCKGGVEGVYDEEEGVLINDSGSEYYVPKEFLEKVG